MPRARRYPSELTDAQGALIEPLLPPPAKTARPQAHPHRDIVDAMVYVARAGGYRTCAPTAGSPAPWPVAWPAPPARRLPASRRLRTTTQQGFLTAVLTCRQPLQPTARVPPAHRLPVEH